MVNNNSNVKRQLSFRSVSNGSSIIETPPLQKRMKQGSQNNSTARGNRIFSMAYAAGPPQQLMHNEVMMVPQPAFQRSFTTKEGGSPLSLLSRWRQADPILTNKYSSGATPPCKRASRPSAALQQKSQSLYFNRPANQTLPSAQDRGKITNGLILSPNENELQMISPGLSGMGMDDLTDNNNKKHPRKFELKGHENGDIKQKLMFDEQSSEYNEKQERQPQENHDEPDIRVLSIKKMGKSNRTSCKNVLAQTLQNKPPVLMGQAAADLHVPYHNTNNFF